ncbi:hypothetical protein U1Q18_048913 [Sarracenia purpurea var. burkii]
MQLIFLMHLLSGYYLLYGFEKSPFLRSSRSKNNPGKAPKKIHKAEREKLKRENLNALFVKLSNTLDPAHQNNGKASILTLLSESHYVSTEKDELIEEKSTLETQIEELKSEVQQRIHSKSAWIDHLQPLHETASHLQEDHHHLVTPANDDASQPAPILGPMFVVPLHHHDLPVYHESNTLDSMSQLPSNISRPHARYPSSSDSWPSQILAKPSETAQIARISSSISSSSTNSRGD